MKRDYDTTVARIAGNILSGVIGDLDGRPFKQLSTPKIEETVASIAVGLARAIVAETRRTEPKPGV